MIRVPSQVGWVLRPGTFSKSDLGPCNKGRCFAGPLEEDPHLGLRFEA